jgi:uncharacterized caspase-like protein
MRRFLSQVLIMLLGTSLSFTTARAERRVALVVGNAGYQHATRLANPVNDARDMKVKLEALGFEVVQALDTTVDTFDAAVADFERKATGADLALFFYAGHGLQFSGVNYLLPIDVRIDNDSALRRRAVLAQEIIDKMERVAKASLVFLDACRNNTLLRDLERSLTEQTRNAASQRGLARMDPRGTNTLIAFATAPNEVAADGTGTRNSPFSTALLKHIDSANVSVQDMLTSVAGDVLRNTGQKQKPEVLSRLTRRIVLNERALVAVPPPSPSSPVAPAPVAASREAEASVAWGAVKDTCDRGRLLVFRLRYGETFFGDLAKQRLDQIVQGSACGQAAVVSPQPPPNPTEDKSLVRALQTELKRVGCYDGNVDGIWGDSSTAALQVFTRSSRVRDLEISAAALERVSASQGRICPQRCSEGQFVVDGACQQKQVTRQQPEKKQSNDVPAASRSQATSNPNLSDDDQKSIAAFRARMGYKHFCNIEHAGTKKIDKRWHTYTQAAARDRALKVCKSRSDKPETCRVTYCE